MKIFVSAGEVSGDNILGEVLDRLRGTYPNIKLCGIGGQATSDQGLLSLFPIERTAVNGVIDVLRQPFFMLRIFLKMSRTLKNFKPDLVLLVDYPGLNLRLASRARALGFPVYYIAPPQTWVYKNSKARMLRVYKALKGCEIHFLFRFESANYLRCFKLDPNRVHTGHFFKTVPMLEGTQLSLNKPRVAHLDSMGNSPVALSPKKVLLNLKDLSPRTALCLCPGSRKSDLQRNLPLWLARLLNILIEKKIPILILVPKHLKKNTEIILNFFLSDHSHELDQSSVNLIQITDDKETVFEKAKWAIAYPGTMTLELTLQRIPVWILAVLDPITLKIGRRLLLNASLLGLANLMIKEKVFPEFIGTAVEFTQESFQKNWLELMAFSEKEGSFWVILEKQLELQMGMGNGAVIAEKECLRILEKAV